jgi:hypothetical protein
MRDHANTGRAILPREAVAIDRGDLPERGRKLRLANHRARADLEAVLVEQLDARHARRPLVPAIGVRHHFEDAIDRRVDVD